MTGKWTCIHGRTERQVCRKCDEMDRALHPVSDATPALAAALEDAAWTLYWNVTDAAGNRYAPSAGVLKATRAVLDDVRARRLASEPVPATPACICGRAVPVAGTCFDIDGAYWSGHGEAVPATGLRWIGSGVSVSRQLAGEPVPATCIGCDFTGNTAAVSYINPKCPVHGTVPATDRRASDGLPVNHPDRGWINGAPVSPEHPCPTCGCVGSATGNPEGIDVEALARALHEASPASHFRRKCRDDHYLRAEAIAAEYARQREGERR